MIDPSEEFARHVTRRTFLGGAAGTLGTAALSERSRIDALAASAATSAAASTPPAQAELTSKAPNVSAPIFLLLFFIADPLI